MSQPRTELSQHWPVVLGAAIGLGCGLTQMQYVGSLFIKGMQADFHWSRGQIAAGQGALLLGVVTAPIVGWLFDRYGARIVSMISAVLLGAVFLGMALQPGAIKAYYLLSALSIVVGGATGPIGYTRAVVTWFARERGLALSLTLVGTSVVAMGLIPGLSWLIAAHGWRSGYAALAVMAWIAVPVVFLLVRERDGAGHGRPAGAAAHRPGMTFGQAARSYRFYLLFAVLFVATAALVAVISQLSPILTDRGLGLQAAGAVMTVLPLATIVGRLGIGVAFDRMWAPIPAMLALMAAVAGCLLMGVHAGLWAAFAGVALIGFAQGAEVDITGYFIARYFGVGAYAMIYAVVGLSFALGAVAGAVFAGAAYDHFHDYDAVLTAAAAGFAVSGLLILLMGRYPGQPAPDVEAAAAALAAQ